MLGSLRRLWGRGAKANQFGAVQAWADAQGHRFLLTRDGLGCVIEPALPQPGWRLEYGAPQRSYIATRELRLLGDAGTPKELTALVLNRELMEQMEKTVFEQYVEDVQTRIDTETPAEMRWLVMFAKLSSGELGVLRDRYAAVCSVKTWGAQWLAGPLGDALAATVGPTLADTPVVLALSRGRLTLRVEAAEPDGAELSRWHSVLQQGTRQARRLVQEWTDNLGGVPSSEPAAELLPPLEDEA